ncbi:AAA family ATPase [Bacillus safensis]|uniref:AAA family ATPase n=1 Tax=Bacillus safensis TaxID=561879 RepID=UPI002481A386|nr:AAA family ATPase [Bacillus safensis]MDI0273534.1 AAA family ATPase [Bacillus safensis]
MSQKLFLEKLTLIGFRKNYEVEFKSGLNFISGPMSTGKSSIAEMINYAFGSEKHNAYIEIRNSCKEVALEFSIGQRKFKIVRPLFDFNRPVKLYRWLEETNTFSENFELFPIDTPANEASLSAFLLNEIGLADITVANQTFSFRDLFKYCYVRQSSIDSDNLLKEKDWGPSIKRRPTFEIIFNIYNDLLGDLKQKLKEKGQHINILVKKRDGVFEFLKEIKIADVNEILEEKDRLKQLLSEKNNKLVEIKASGKYDDEFTLNLEEGIAKLKGNIINNEMEIQDKIRYIEKLILLRNQYSSEVQKIEFILEGALVLNRYDFEICPSCLNPFEEKKGCNLCGGELKDLSESEIRIYKSELTRIKRKFNGLTSFIESQESSLSDLKRDRREKNDELNRKQIELDRLRNNYISPFIEQIEQINFEIGKIHKNMEQLENNLIVISQFSKLNEKILEEENLYEGLKKQIENLQLDTITKDEVIQNLSILFNDILKEFNFPKLSEAYIKDSNYLPYVRGVKYDELGSGGAITMTTMAYFLSIALLKTDSKNHPGFLIIDSPRKNLGSDAKNNDEFKDEEIFNSIIKYFISITNNDSDSSGKVKKEVVEVINDLQLIVINNGYPDFLNQNDIIKEFDGKGTKNLPYGLIDDIENP